MAIEDRIYEKSVEYLSDIPELADEKPSKLLIGFVTEKFKQCRNYPPSFTDAKIESDMEKHLNTIAMAVVDLKAKEGAEGETSHSENSISRSYENAYVSSSIFNDVLPYVHFLQKIVRDQSGDSTGMVAGYQLIWWWAANGNKKKAGK